MLDNIEPGLGQLLRCLVELTDESNNNWYQEQSFSYRARYTPIMRALNAGATSVTKIKNTTSITQGAVSQTIRLMLEDNLIEKVSGSDARESIFQLTPHGESVLQQLKPHWSATFKAIDGLEQELQLPLLNILKNAQQALKDTSFADRISAAKSAQAAKPEATKANEFFQSDGKNYLAFRPSYPTELAKTLSTLTTESGSALDVGCGNGQLTRLLAPYFDIVQGIDPSASQIAQAVTTDNVSYSQQPAENIHCPDNSVDLVVAAQAAHWFDLDAFYNEARRIAKANAVIALISYGVPYISGAVNSIFQQGYWQTIHKFWSSERVHVENNYASLYFPFTKKDVPDHRIKKQMGVESFIGYIKTWSAYTTAEKKGETHLFEQFFDQLRASWPHDEWLEVIWPISVKAGMINEQ